MISNQILQNTIDGTKNITGKDYAVLDTDGIVLATTTNSADDYVKATIDFVESDMEAEFNGPCNMYKVFDGGQVEFVLLAFLEGQDTTVGKILAFQIEGLLVAYKERFDKDNFVKNLILDNMLLVDIYNRAKKLHIDIEARRVVMIGRFDDDKNGDEFDKVRSIFGGKNKDFVTAVDESSVIVVKDMGETGSYDDIEKTAKVIVETFKDKKKGVRVSYGTIVSELKEVSRSYKEAGMALDVGKIFFGERDIIAYSVLGIGRLIYQLHTLM